MTLGSTSEAQRAHFLPREMATNPSAMSAAWQASLPRDPDEKLSFGLRAIEAAYEEKTRVLDHELCACALSREKKAQKEIAIALCQKPKPFPPSPHAAQATAPLVHQAAAVPALGA